MRLESYLVAEMIKGLDTQAASLRSHTAALAKALSARNYPTALEVAHALESALSKFVATTDLLEQHLVAHDGIGALGDSIDELVLRARTRVIQEALRQLGSALVDPEDDVRPGDWYVGRFQCFADVTTFIEQRIAEVHAYWRPYRHDEPRRVGMTEADRDLVCNAMLRAAQGALRELHQETDLLHFLETGASATSLPAVQQPCRAILAMLGLPMDVEPARSFRRPRAAPLTRAVEGQ